MSVNAYISHICLILNKEIKTFCVRQLYNIFVEIGLYNIKVFYLENNKIYDIYN